MQSASTLPAAWKPPRSAALRLRAQALGLAALATTLVASCEFPLPGADVDPGPGPPPLGDAPCELRDRSICVHLVELADQSLPDGVLDTDTSDLCAKPPLVPAAAPYCVIRAAALTVPAGVTVRAIGARPLVLVATGAVTINGTIDVSSRREALPSTPKSTGAGGGHATSCLAFLRAAQPKSAGGIGGGGGGGTFGGLGGSGGDGDAGSADPAVGGLPTLMRDPQPTTLRAGCRGGQGAGISAATKGGDGGDGGGALYVASKLSITVNLGGQLAANGAGGLGGDLLSGGGGGGSGGLLVLDAPTVTRGGRLTANGGGGGEGGSASAAGLPGADGLISTAHAAGGDSGAPSTSAGGAGGARSPIDGEYGANSPAAAGGGAGGGTGVIRIYGATGTAGPVESPGVQHTP
ncbi:MAG: hypothetical protein IPI49_14655 [Myxococcales bacterium]|nr:hypothetical protein [Myxococcales bacterium]